MRQYGIQPTFQVGLDSTYKMPDDDDRSVYSGTSAGFTTRWNEAPNAMSRFSADSRGNVSFVITYQHLADVEQSPFAAFAMPKFGRQGVALPERPRQSRAQGQISPPRPKHTRGDTLHPSDVSLCFHCSLRLLNASIANLERSLSFRLLSLYEREVTLESSG